ncbi:MAG: DUF6922 domain-containing protein, partial [Terriglobia bacterium]
MVPSNLRSLFWDVNLDTFRPAAFPEYSIARVLEYGDREAVAWLRETFREEAIKRVISDERRLSRRSANFWALAYGIPSHEVAAL